MADQSYQQAQWLISDYDFRVHAFTHATDTYLEALCLHTAPPDKIVRPEDTTLVPPHCHRCLTRYGEDIASLVQRWTD
jgi:hypothetical protein